MSMLLTDAHLPDGALIRWIDSETAPAEREELWAHLEQCDGCAERLDLLQRRSVRLSALLVATQPPVPEWVPSGASVQAEVVSIESARERRALRSAALSRAPWLRIAAGLALLLAIGVVAPPVRAWVVEWAGRGWGEVAAVFGAGEREVGPPAATDPGHTRVSFVPAGEELVLEIARRQTGGALILQVHDAADATVEVRGGRGENVLVLPERVRVENPAGSSADYRVTLPPGLESVRVRVGGEAPLRIPLSELETEGERVIPLRRLD